MTPRLVAVDYFVRPPVVGHDVTATTTTPWPTARARRPDRQVVPRCVAVLSAPDMARGLGVAVARRVARRHESATATAVIWSGGDRAIDVAADIGRGSRAVRAQTRILADAGLSARSVGLVSVVHIDADDDDDVREVERVLEIVDGPSVIVIAAPRTDEIERPLRRVDAVLVGDGSVGAVADLCIAEFHVAGIPAIRMGPTSAIGVTVAERHGTVLTPLRRCIDIALDTVAPPGGAW